MSPTVIFFVSSDILEGGSEHGLDAIGTEGAGEVVSELHAKLLFNLTDALLGHAERLGAAGFLTQKVVDDAATEDISMAGLQGRDEGIESRGDGLGVLGALHADILTQPGARDDGCHGATVSAQGSVEGGATGGHGREALAHVLGLEAHMLCNLLWGRVIAQNLTSLLKSAPELLRGAGTTVEHASVRLDVLLALGGHPHPGVGREGRALGRIELVDGDEDALGRAGEQVLEVQTRTEVLLGDLVGQPNVGLDQSAAGLLANLVVTLVGLREGAQVSLLGLAEDNGGGGEGREKVRHVGFSRVVDLHPIYIAGCVPTWPFWPFILLIE